MNTKEIIETCNRVDALVRERDEDEFMWEDAIAEINIKPEMGVVVLALLFTARGDYCSSLSQEVESLLQPTLTG